MDTLKINSLILCVLLSIGPVFSYNVVLNLSHNGPVVLGANITFTAILTDYLNQQPVGEFAYEWHDDAKPQHFQPMVVTSNTTVYWNVSYPSNLYSAHEYEVRVKAFIEKYIYIQIAHQEMKFDVTETLNGNIEVEQENQKDTNVFVSNTTPVKHTIKLSQADHDFIANHATSVLTFWFVDCVYYGFSTDYTFSFNYTEEKTYNVEALVVASFDEPPITTTTTTTPATTPAATTSSSSTTTTTTTTTTTNSSSFSTPTTPSPAATTTTTSKLHAASPTSPSATQPSSTSTAAVVNDPFRTDLSYSHAEPVSAIEVPTTPSVLFSTNDKSVSPVEVISTSGNEEQLTVQGTLLPMLRRVALQKRHVTGSINSVLNTTKDFPFVQDILSYACLNSTFVPPDPNKTYGYFHKRIAAKAPISKVVVKGNNWLQFGDVLNLNITCNGSGKFQHCSKIKIGAHNITGNETCSSPLEEDACDFTLTHYFREANTYTYIIVIMNDVSKVVTPAVITMYKVTVQPQLSVIVVPVTCSLLAIIIIVFGVAYYVQSQNRYTVEVADFDFGQANDMEYKSFYERLREDISNMFSRSGDFLDQANVMPQRSKYDNMEES